MSSVIDEDVLVIFKNVDFSILTEKSVLITGASGLLGVYFIASLKEAVKYISGIKIYAVYKSDPSPFLIDLFNFQELETYQGDITNSKFVESLPSADFIIHASGYGQPLKFMADPVRTLKMNTFSTFLLFDKLNDGGHFLYLSSSEVYSGLPAIQHLEREIGVTNTTHVRACYIEGKRGGEAICNAYRTKGVHASSVRLSYTYGPGARAGDQRVLLSLIEKSFHGSIKLLDSGDAVRTFCYVSDAVEFMWYILLFGKQPIYNISGKERTTIANLAKLIGKKMDVPVIFPSVSNEIAGAPIEVELNTSLVEQESGKSDYHSLDEGVSKTIRWYKEFQNSSI
ncbi:MAG TPA: NAD-dependent epimerase/dehydratase family protein [Puia sp.]|nr:NAD-dependent epimerase/dehydratase family protein [Puia sp.]